jgi:hypothetical protein
MNIVYHKSRYNASYLRDTTLDITDLPKAMLVLSKAYEYLVLNSNSAGEKELGNEETAE